MALFDSADGQRWKEALALYDEALQRVADRKKDPSKLQALDKWFYSAKEAKGAEVDKAYVCKVAEWKLSRGTFRPGLLQKVQSNSEQAVKKAFAAASESIEEDPAKALKALDAALAGVGPATASAVLCRAFPNKVAFMSDEAMLGCGLFSKASEIKYDLKTFARFNEIVQQKALELGAPWTGDAVAKALWATRTLQRDAAAPKPAVMKVPATKVSSSTGVRKTIAKTSKK